MHKHWYVIAYDIAFPRRLRRVYNMLRANAYRLQNSTFLFQGSSKELQQLYRNLCKELNAKEDDLRIFPLAKQWNIQFWGQCPLDDSIHDHQWPRFKHLQTGQWQGRVIRLNWYFDHSLRSA